MIRAIAVVVVAAICAALFGVEGTVLAQQNTASRLRIIEERVSRMKIGDIVKGERTDGTKFEGRLVAKTADSVTVDVYRRRAFRRLQRIGTETLMLTELRDLKKPLSGAQQALIVAGVAVGACAVAATLVATNLDSKPGERPSDGVATSDEATAVPATEPQHQEGSMVDHVTSFDEKTKPQP